jgi:aminomuconate-semialdehyde/2-hydroxymuconate-6-semialdehyde dehydrogenase
VRSAGCTGPLAAPDVGQAVAAAQETAKIDRVTFAGSTATGRTVGEAAACNLLAVALELGGKGATVVLDTGAATNPRAVFNNSGQVCLAGTRVLVHRAVREEFVDLLVAHAEKLRVGDPFDPETDLGPLASGKQFERVRDYFDRMPVEGGKVVTGGPLENWSFAPTVVMGIDPSSRLAHEEVFGPDGHGHRKSTTKTRPSYWPTTLRMDCPACCSPSLCSARITFRRAFGSVRCE